MTDELFARHDGAFAEVTIRGVSAGVKARLLCAVAMRIERQGRISRGMRSYKRDGGVVALRGLPAGAGLKLPLCGIG